MGEKYLMISLEDEKSKKLGEILGNATCKKIINFLAEKEASESEISSELRIPLNTVEYNIRKLVDSEIIEKASKFWSVKGRRIDTYRVANKFIVISPKKNIASKLKEIFGMVVISGILALIIRAYSQANIRGPINAVEKSIELPMLQSSANVADIAFSNIMSVPAWIWFLLGSLFAIIIFSIIKWRKL